MLVCSFAADLFYVVLLLLMQLHDNVMVSGLNGAAGDRHCRAALAFF